MTEQAHWTDLPEDDQTLVLGYSTEEARTLDELVKAYNGLQKDCLERLGDRVEALQSIATYITDWIQSRLTGVEKVKHLDWLRDIAVKKRNYLKGLSELYRKGLDKDEALQAHHFDTTGLEDPSCQAIILNNQSFFSLKMREYWGDFWLESVDPCHRRLTPFYRQWKRLCGSDSSTPPFFLWLETQELPKYVPTVRYLSEGELQDSKVTVQDGLLLQRGQKANWSEPSERYLFAIGLDKSIYVSTESYGCSHSSFTHGKPVLGAGLFTAMDGQILSLALESGHYLPSVEVGYQIIKILEEQGVHWPDELEVAYFYDRNKYTAKVSSLDLVSLDTFKAALQHPSAAQCTR